MPGMALLSYPLVGLLLTLLGAALLAATRLIWQPAPAWHKISRARKRREEALKQMAALAQRLQQQVSGPQSLKLSVSVPTGGSYLRTYPSHCLDPFRRRGAWGDSPPPQLSPC